MVVCAAITGQRTASCGVADEQVVGDVAFDVVLPSDANILVNLNPHAP